MPRMPERNIALQDSRVVAPMCGEPKNVGTSSSGLPLEALLERVLVDNAAARAIDQE